MSVGKVLLAVDAEFVNVKARVEEFGLYFGASLYWTEPSFEGGAWEAVLAFGDADTRKTALQENHGRPGHWSFYLHPADHLEVRMKRGDYRSQDASERSNTRLNARGNVSREQRPRANTEPAVEPEAGDLLGEPKPARGHDSSDEVESDQIKLRQADDDLPTKHMFIHFPERHGGACAARRSTSEPVVPLGARRQHLAAAHLAALLFKPAQVKLPDRPPETPLRRGTQPRGLDRPPTTPFQTPARVIGLSGSPATRDARTQTPTTLSPELTPAGSSGRTGGRRGSRGSGRNSQAAWKEGNAERNAERITERHVERERDAERGTPNVMLTPAPLGKAIQRIPYTPPFIPHAPQASCVQVVDERTPAPVPAKNRRRGNRGGRGTQMKNATRLVEEALGAAN